MIDKVVNFATKNKEALLIIVALLLVSLLWNNTNLEYVATKKKLAGLKADLAVKESEYQKLIAEKVALQDSSRIYELAAQQAGRTVAALEARVQREKKAKQEALDKLKNLPVKAIDSILTARYDTVPKAGVDLTIDKNVGNAIVIELAEKDQMASHVVTISALNATLKNQVLLLDKSLSSSKAALVLADSATQNKTVQYELSQKSVELLKQDLKVAKKKGLSNQVKGTVLGIAAGILINLIAK